MKIIEKCPSCFGHGQLFYSYSIVILQWKTGGFQFCRLKQPNSLRFMVKAIGHFSKKVQVSSTNQNLAGINVLCFIMLWAVFKSQSSFKISSFYLEAKGGTNLVLVHKLYCCMYLYSFLFFKSFFNIMFNYIIIIQIYKPYYINNNCHKIQSIFLA